MVPDSGRAAEAPAPERLTYTLGHPSRSFSLPGGAIGSADVKMNGGGAFGVLYLPVPVVSVYLKGGLARLEATSNVTVAIPGLICQINIPSCTRFTKTYRTTNTSFAAGAGVQVKLGPIALRAEYERFNAAGGNPGLASLGAFWNFL